MSSSRSGGRKRFKGGKGSAPSSKPSGFRKWEPSPCLTLSGGCLSLHWQAWRDWGMVPWVVEVLRVGYRIPFLRPPPLSTELILMPSYAPTSIEGAALGEVTLMLIAKGAVELAPLPSPGFSSRRFLVWKTSGSWRPVIDLSLLNCFVDISHCRLVPIQSVLMSVRQGDWMASVDLREAYPQVPVHPESRRFLRFVAHGRTERFMRCALVCPRHRRSSLGLWLLWLSLNHSLVPSLALSWSSPCRISRRAWMLTCFFALSMPFAFLLTGLCLWLRVGAASSSLRAAPHAPCLKMRSHFYCARSFMGLRRPVLSGFDPCP